MSICYLSPGDEVGDGVNKSFAFAVSGSVVDVAW